MRFPGTNSWSARELGLTGGGGDGSARGVPRLDTRSAYDGLFGINGRAIYERVEFGRFSDVPLRAT
jgi:hypothetical protein